MPTDQYFEAFLHMAESTDIDNPAPFSWPEWRECIVDTVPPWAMSATPENSRVSADRIEKIKAFAQGYYALSNAKDRTVYCQRRGSHNNEAGREAMIAYLAEEWPKWGINEIIDGILKASDIDVYTMAEPGMAKLYALDLSPVVGLYRDIAVKIFGDDAYQNSLMIKEPATRFVRTLCAGYWRRLRNKLTRERTALRKAERLVEQEREVFEKLAVPNGAAGLRYIRALEMWLNRLSKWKVDHLGEQHAEASETLEGIKDQLQGVPTTASKKLPAALAAALATLATMAESRQVLGVVLELIAAFSHDEEEPVMRAPLDLDTWSDGVEEYYPLEIEQIARALGLIAKGLPFFSPVQDPIGELDPWTEEGQAVLESEAAQPLVPMWHQWVGILKIADNLFEGMNILIMDEVGVGKTLQAVGAVAIFEYQRLHHQQQGEHSPRFCPMSKGKVPLTDDTHIFVVPPGLIHQWIMELHRYLKHGSFSVLPYTGNCTIETRQAFWALYKTVSRPTIILASSTAVKSDMVMFFKKPTKGIRPQPSLACAQGLIDNTLFSASQRYGIFVLDEAHFSRTFNKLRVACVELTARSRMTIALTATPVMTGAMDLVNLATWLEIPGVIDAEMTSFKRGVERARRSERKKRVDGDGEVRLARAVALGKLTKDANKDEVKQANHVWIASLREIYKGYMMRRTIYSRDNHDKPISGLDPWIESSILIPLTEQEMLVQRLIAETLAKEGVSVDSNAVGTFYLTIRQSLLHSGFSQITGYTFSDADQLKPYSDHPSTKINAVLRLLQWHIGHVCRAPLTYDDEAANFQPMAVENWPQSNSMPDTTPTDKAIVYLAFPSLNWLIKSALEEHGILYQEINGLLSTAQRAAALTDFRTSSTVHVLLLSGVGLCGLNMAFANIVIIVDNLWSAQEDQQLIGRVWRYSQPKQVLVYRVIAQDTSDVFLNNIGFQKGTLHNEFAGIESTIRHAFKPTGDATIDDGSAEKDTDNGPKPSEDPPKKQKAAARGAGTRAAKKPATPATARPEDPIDAPNPTKRTSTAKPKPRAPRKKQAKSSEISSDKPSESNVPTDPELTRIEPAGISANGDNAVEGSAADKRVAGEASMDDRRVGGTPSSATSSSAPATAPTVLAGTLASGSALGETRPSDGGPPTPSSHMEDPTAKASASPPGGATASAPSEQASGVHSLATSKSQAVATDSVSTSHGSSGVIPPTITPSPETITYGKFALAVPAGRPPATISPGTSMQPSGGEDVAMVNATTTNGPLQTTPDEPACRSDVELDVDLFGVTRVGDDDGTSSPLSALSDVSSEPNATEEVQRSKGKGKKAVRPDEADLATSEDDRLVKRRKVSDDPTDHKRAARKQTALLGLGTDTRPATLAELPPAGGSARGGKKAARGGRGTRGGRGVHK